MIHLMDCQSGCVQSSLLMLVQSLLYGNQSSDASYSQEVLTIAQLIQFNTTNSKNSRHYHLKNNEPPLPVYIGLLIYSRTRKRDLIDTQYELGWSISYDRILKILDTTKNTICAQYEKDDTVCPPNLRNGQFTTSAVDNNDHNTSSTHSNKDFHGTRNHYSNIYRRTRCWQKYSSWEFGLQDTEKVFARELY